MAFGKQGTGVGGEKGERESLGPYFSLAGLGWAGLGKRNFPACSPHFLDFSSPEATCQRGRPDHQKSLGQGKAGLGYWASSGD